MTCEISKALKNLPVYNTLYGDRIADFDLHNNYFTYPTLERKSIVTGFPNNWMSEKLKQAIEAEALEYNASSGTTSERMQIFRSKKWWVGENQRTYKFNKHLNRYLQNKEKKMVLTTAICSNTACYINLPPYHERIIGDTLYLNISADPNSWQKEDILRMINEINTYKPALFDVDPIYLALFLKLKEKFDIKEEIYQPDIIKLTYEYVTHYSRSYIEQYFKNSPTLIIYGSTETGYNLFEREDKKFQHVPDQCYIDFEHIDTDLYFIKITSWKNEYMPLVNYKIGDLARISEENMASNLRRDGTPVIVDRLSGRMHDTLAGRDGKLVAPGDVDHSLSQIKNDILIYQLKFYSSELCHFRYVTIHDHIISLAEEEEIRNSLHQLYGNSLKIEFLHEKSIHPEASGKFSLIKKG